ncbi:MAG TPA: UvrD-helicase domain-containing protein, partial [Thermohalobaculum sp.]|nr:UvrD-helicase domain-containing protein [Thermohalobaculum sp.]
MRREIERPTPAQIAAADPQASPWVGANAGSGKTRVLAQRVARLLLAGTPPERILCLTYTKAAAAEMQNRLFAMLGAWAMAGDDWLGAQLAALEGRAAGPADPENLARARRLFARALETPGGLRIQTIHAFCDALLRRFPLEAGLSPRFEVLDDRQARLMQEQIRTRLAVAAEGGHDPAFDRVAGRVNEGDLDSLIAAVQGKRDGFPEGDLDDRLEAHFGPDAARGEAEIAADALAELDRARLARLADLMLAHGKDDAHGNCARAIGALTAIAETEPLKAAETLAASCFTTGGTLRRRTRFPVRAVLDAWPEADGVVEGLLAWAERTSERLKVAEAVQRTRALDAFATRLLAAYEAAKRARALLDFDDLIERAHDLLVRSDMAAWVLWKLDHGIDHILVDEAQDTAPRQWALIEAIAEEFYAGEGAREIERTVFVVGDEKQSIYSFQGAEPAAFGSTRARMAERLRGVGRALREPALETSFRSAPGILRFVDAVFAGEEAEGLTLGGLPPAHRAHRTRDGARIDLWPLVVPPEKPEEPPWWEPIDRPPPDDPRTRLAETLAGEIRRMLAEDRLPPRAGRPGRRVRPGDVLVLVGKRDRLAATLIRKLKSLDVPVAGADRLSLTAELAVRDLLALVRVSLTPADDLSLAALLRSPLCGWSEEALFALAHGRGRAWLWSRLMQAEPRSPAAEMLADMAAQADYLRPYEFLERALIHH